MARANGAWRTYRGGMTWRSTVCFWRSPAASCSRRRPLPRPERSSPAATGSPPNAGSFPLAIAAGVLVVAYFGLAHQYFSLRFGGRGKMYLMLFLFLAWILPLIAGTIVLLGSISSSTQGEKATQVIISLSPLAGIALTAFGDDPATPIEGIHAAVITPALLFTFVFHSLLVAARRRVYKSFRSSRTG